MRKIVLASTVALALLAGCGGGDSDTALTPGSSESPTLAPSTSASATATAKTKAKKTALADGDSDDEYGGPTWNNTEPATGEYLPLGGALLPEHVDGTPYPASQLSPTYSDDVIVRCEGLEFPVSRLTHRRPVADLSKSVKKGIEGYIGGFVAIADEHHVLVLEPYPNDPDSFDYAEVTFESASNGKHRWWTDTDYPPSSCVTTRVLPDLGQVFWNRAVKPKPDDRSIQVSFTDYGCDAKAAIAGVKVAILDMGPDAVRVALGREGPGPKTDPKCKKGEQVIYTVQLPGPIGDRKVINAELYPEAEPRADYPTCDGC